jgi:hypothetical protein
VHITERRGDQRRGPAAMTGWRRAVENRQNAPAGLGGVFGHRTAIAGFVQPGKPVGRIANPPFARRPGGTAHPACNRPRRQAVRSQKHNLRPLPYAMLAFARTRQALQLAPLIRRQFDRSRFLNPAHAAIESRLTVQR